MLFLDELRQGLLFFLQLIELFLQILYLITLKGRTTFVHFLIHIIERLLYFDERIHRLRFHQLRLIVGPSFAAARRRVAKRLLRDDLWLVFACMLLILIQSLVTVYFRQFDCFQFLDILWVAELQRRD